MHEQLDRMEAKLDLLLDKKPTLPDLFPGKSPEEIVELQAEILREQLPAIDTTEAPPTVRSVMDTLEGIRGYPSGNYGAEGKAIKTMLKTYTPAEILGCYTHLKEQHFWEDKALIMPSVAKEIGEWKKHAGRTIEERVTESQEQDRAKVLADYERRWNPDSPWVQADEARQQDKRKECPP